ncbi:TPM domain-containing protein [Thermodesulfobacteriota bacterium]
MSPQKQSPTCMLAIFFVAGIFFLGGSAIALEVPDLEDRVNDYASILSPPTVSLIEGMLEELEDEESTQIVVLTIPSLEGETIEAFSLEVAETWQIGQEGLDNGALLVISSGDRKLRIEVGYGLEGRLTDLVCGRIIRDIIVPHFKEGRFGPGVLEGVGAMISAVRGEFKGTGQGKGAARMDEEALEFIIVMFVFAFIFIGRAAMSSGLVAILASIASIPVGLFWYHENMKIVLAGFAGGLMASLLVPFGMFLFGAKKGKNKDRYWGGYMVGGAFSSSSSGGGFSGGGGGFGGGGASGGW